ncbi:putative tick transposon [Operophtera brumata]|uniref:Putative tick transposon n=1 Tax=Operophtera brumata TaxID=104452 RepID=A0A0L7KTV2_OPEBR|nr:putative tick transposon [Operophtera brumata]
MNVMHSPTTPITGGGSQPDLSKLNSEDKESLVTFRKRKHPMPDQPCECSYEIKEIRGELTRMTSMLEKYVETNQNIINQMQESITEVKTQLTDLKTSNEKAINLIQDNLGEAKAQISEIKSTSISMQIEQNIIKTHVTQLESKITFGKNKLSKLETQVCQKSMLTPSVSSTSQSYINEEMIRELKERNERDKNIIIVGLPEHITSNIAERLSKDEFAVMNVTSAVAIDIPKPTRVFRIGKFIPGKTRRVKICFDAAGPAKQLLRITSTSEITTNNMTYQTCDNYSNLTISKSRLTFFYLNARSIRKLGKFDELKCIIQSISTTIHVILLTETWIANESQAQEFQLPNYTHYYNFRTDKRGGGVSDFVHNNLKHNISESIYLDGNNYLWISLEKYALEVGVIYHPGDTNYKKFVEVYDGQLQQRKRSIVFGDFNIDLLTKENQSKQYKELLNEAGYRLLNKINKKYSTRDSTTRKSILDHVCSNLKNNDFHMAIINSPMTDHKQIYFEMKKFKPAPKIRKKFDAIDYSKLYTSIETAKLDPMNSDYTIFENTIKHHITKCKVTKNKILNLPQDEWIHNEIISEINKRNQLWTELKKQPDNEALKIDFKEKRDYTAKLIQTTKNTFYYKEFIKCTKKPKKMWKIINNLANNKNIEHELASRGHLAATETVVAILENKRPKLYRMTNRFDPRANPSNWIIQVPTSLQSCRIVYTTEYHRRSSGALKSFQVKQPAATTMKTHK